MAVKYTPKGRIHQGNKGGKTGCGSKTKNNPKNWVHSRGESITCDKNGCKN